MQKQILIAFLAFPVFGATLTVTTPFDNGPGSLRNAISNASDGDTIVFESTLHNVVLTTGELNIERNISIAGPGRGLLTVVRDDNALHFRVLTISASGAVVIAGVTIRGGYADASFGGGIYNALATLTLTDCGITDNASVAGAGGGGIYNSGDLTIRNSVIAFNSATSPGFFFHVGSGGGISNGGALTIINSTISSNSAVLNGGGIHHSAGSLTILNSTLGYNRAGSELPLSGNGGAVLAAAGTVQIVNSTISTNLASGQGSGAGLFNEATALVANSTITDNFATLGGNDIFNVADLQIQNTILGSDEPTLQDSGGTVASQGFNLSSDNGGGFLTAHGDQINVVPMLGGLADNGGPTLTHKLLRGSPAIDAGDPDFSAPPVDDQRGFSRVFGGRLDVGALESQPTPTATPGPTSTPLPTSSPTPTATPPPSPTATATPPPPPSPTIAPTPTATVIPSSSSLLNISTRGIVQGGNGVLIAGFIVAAESRIAVRGIGPSLGISGALTDPTLELHDGNGALIMSCDNWGDNYGQAVLLHNAGLELGDWREAGIVATVAAGHYTAILGGKGSGGIGLVEVYSLTR